MNTTTLPQEDPILQWTAPQHAHPERGKVWYVGATAFVVLLIGYSIWTAAWTFSVLIVALGVMYWKMHSNEPPEKTIRIWKRGFALEDDFYDWNSCTGYWIFRGRDYAEIHIEKGNGGEVKIQTGEMNAYQAHEAISPFLKELTDRKEHILDTIIRICKL